MRVRYAHRTVRELPEPSQRRYFAVMERPPASDRVAHVKPARDRRNAVLAARRRPMAQRLELALAWDELAVELRSGLVRAQARRR